MKMNVRKATEREEGFTLVELLIVMIVSLILLAGFVGLVTMGFEVFSSSKSTQAMSDASRRALPAMSRQMVSLLRIDDSQCVAQYKVGSQAGAWEGTCFYADIDNDNSDADVDNYENAERVEFFRSGDRLMQRTTEPGNAGVTTTAICSYVESVRFYYFPAGVAPGNDSPPANRYQGESLNDNAGSVKVVLVLRKGGQTRTYEQNVFLRILQRG